jgi:L-alanine-DL-glutamate epimerase-like enolase superfamily enzyme
VTTVYIAARTPDEVAREVESQLKAGAGRFVLRALDGGGMLDRERLGAAHYAAGFQAEVELDGHPSSSSATGASSAPAPEAARAR